MEWSGTILHSECFDMTPAKPQSCLFSHLFFSTISLSTYWSLYFPISLSVKSLRSFEMKWYWHTCGNCVPAKPIYNNKCTNRWMKTEWLREREEKYWKKKETAICTSRRHGIYLNTFHLNTHPTYCCWILFGSILTVNPMKNVWSSMMVFTIHTSDDRNAYAITICIFRMNRGGEMLFGAFVHQSKLLGRRSFFHCLALYHLRRGWCLLVFFFFIGP